MFPWGNITPFEYMTGHDQQINENPSSSSFSIFPTHLQIRDDGDFLLSPHLVKHIHKEHIPPPPPYDSPLPPVDGLVQADDKAGARQIIKSVDDEGSKDSNTKAAAPEASEKIPALITRSSSTVKKPSAGGGGSTSKRRRTAAAAARKPPGAPRRRIGKKDRHSKICTAHGPRDRRMRLSLQIARQFFDLQDMLGFDKASKTIEWLFTMSKSAIEELTASMSSCGRGGACASSTAASDCVVSTGMELESANIDEEAAAVDPHRHSHVILWENKGTDHHNSRARKKKKSYSSSTRHRPIMIAADDLVKERREKARARARQRTNEKRLKKERAEEQISKLELSSPDFTNPMSSCCLEKLASSSSTAETAGEESAGCPSRGFNSSIIMEADECNSPQQSLLENQMDIIEKLLGTTTSSIRSSAAAAAAAASSFLSTSYDPCQLLRDGVSGGIRYSADEDFLDILPAGNWVTSTESTTSLSLGYCEMMTSLIMTGDVGRVQGLNPSSIFILQSDQYPESRFSCNSMDATGNHSLF